MKRIFYVIFFLLLSSTCQAQSIQSTVDKPSFTRLDKIVAIVNTEAITQSELSKEMDQARRQLEHLNQPIPPEAEFRKKVLDNLIGKNLQMQLCKARGVKVKDEDVTKAIKNIAQANKLNVAQLKEALAQTGINFDLYKSQIHDQLQLQKIQQEEVAKKISFSAEDVKIFMRENKNKFNQYSTYHVVDIVLSVPEGSSASQIEQIRKQATNLVQQLQTGKDTDAIIRQYSDVEKNDLGWRALPEFPSLFQSKVATMKIHTLSAPLQAPNGFHILQLVDAKGENIKPTEQDLKNMAFQHKVTEAIKEWVQKIRSDAYVKIM